MQSEARSKQLPPATNALLSRISRRLHRVVDRFSRVPVGAVRWGDLRNLQPICSQFGFTRGKPVDRHYIECFIADHANDISGRVLEIKDAGYTRQFGGSRVKKSDVLDINADNRAATIIADLNDPKALSSGTFDCVIFTQTLQLIFNPAKVIRHLHRALKPGGVLLLTVPGITPVRSRDTWYWSFTELAIRGVLAEAFEPSQISVESYGNVISATAFLQGLSASELKAGELAYYDPAYPMLVGARAVKV